MIDRIPEEYRKGLYFDASFDTVMVPHRFAERIVGHVIANYLPDNHFYRPPLYLVIKGEPGEGKTLQALAACNQRGIMVKYLSASELSGELEAASKDVIKSVYQQAQRLQEIGYYICILLDDFHLGNSNIRNTSHTVNAELLIGYMMNLADSSGGRVPILLTGNDFSNTYEALLRDGRADIFEWAPSLEEKRMVVQSILRPMVLEREWRELDHFIDAYSKQNIAFFAQLRKDIRQAVLLQAIDGVDRIDSAAIQLISSHVRQKIQRVRVAELRQMAETRIDSRKKGGLIWR